MITFGGQCAEQLVFQDKTKLFYARLIECVKVGNGANVCWQEDARSLPPIGIAHRRMLERLFLTYSSGAGSSPPPWVSRTVHEHLKYAARGVPTNANATRTDQPGDPVKGFRPPFGVGAVNAARVLLVGDRPGRGWLGHDFPHWPFVSANTSGASVWLAEQLDAYDIGEEKLFWINSHTVTNEELDPAAVEALPFFTDTLTLTVAFGRRAANWCAAAGWPRLEVYNPVHWHKRYADKPYYPAKLIAGHLGGVK